MYLNIQVLRAIAALLVLLHHMVNHLAQIAPIEFLKTVGGFGYIGVDLFFVISGFVVTQSAMEQSGKMSGVFNFLLKRILRIYPSFWLALIAYYYIGHYNGRDFSNIQWLESISLTSIDLFKLGLPISWSLTYELYFYALLLIVVVWKLRGLSFLMTFFIILVPIFHFLQWGELNKFWFSPFVGEFLAGAVVFKYSKIIEKSNVTPWLSLILLGFSTYFLTQWNPDNLMLRSISGGGIGAALLCMGIWLERYKYVSKESFLVEVGNASFLIYLWHLCFIDSVYYYGVRDQLSALGAEAGLCAYALLTVSFIHICTAAHKSIEKPMNLFLQKLLVPIQVKRPTH